MFITPAFISVFMITFVTFWGARVSPALTVIFICCYVSYGWVKGIHSAVFSLFVGIPRCHAYKDANWRELAMNPQLQSPILDRTFGPQGPVYKSGRSPLSVTTNTVPALNGTLNRVEGKVRVSNPRMRHPYVQGATRDVAQNHWHSPRANVR